MKGNQEALGECGNTCLKGKKTLLIDHLKTYGEKPKVRTEVAEELVEVCLGHAEKEVIKVGCTLDRQQKYALIELLVSRKSNFALCPKDMPGINPEITFL